MVFTLIKHIASFPESVHLLVQDILPFNIFAEGSQRLSHVQNRSVFFFQDSFDFSQIFFNVRTRLVHLFQQVVFLFNKQFS